jgi:hypothetical protein
VDRAIAASLNDVAGDARAVGELIEVVRQQDRILLVRSAEFANIASAPSSLSVPAGELTSGGHEGSGLHGRYHVSLPRANEIRGSWDDPADGKRRVPERYPMVPGYLKTEDDLLPRRSPSGHLLHSAPTR